MAKFNAQAVSGITKQLKDAKQGTGRVLQANKLEEGKPVMIRLIKPRDNQGGEWNYFVMVEQYWINKKPYLSQSFLGKPCPIKAVIEEVEQSGDQDLLSLLASDSFRKKVTNFLPIRVVQVEFDEDEGEVTDIKVEPKIDILECGVSLMDSINDIVCSQPMMRKKSGEGIFGRKDGNAIIISKTGKGLDTSYKAVLDPTPFELEEKWCEEENVADIMAYLKKQLHSPEYTEAVLRNYFYGEELPEKDEWKEARLAKAKLKKEMEAENAAKSNKKKKEDEAEKPKATKKEEPVKAATPKAKKAEEKSVKSASAKPVKSLMDEIDDNLDDLEDDLPTDEEE